MTTSGFHALTLVDRTVEYGDVVSFRFRPDEPLTFVPGQYVHLLAPQSPPGRENVRHLSIASLPDEETLRFTVDLGSHTDYKKKLAALDVGGKAHLFKIKGHFVLDAPAPRLIFLAGGLGITPIYSVLGALVREGGLTPWKLAHVARGEYLYQKEMEVWGGEQRRLRREEVTAQLDAWNAEWPDAFWYVSGSHRFVEGMRSILSGYGLPEERVRVEDFE